MAGVSLEERYGAAVLEPDTPVVAGAYGTWRLRFTVGAAGIARGGAIRVSTDSDTDWGLPQVTNPAGAEYLTAHAPPEARLDVLVEDIKSLRLRVHGQPLRPGATVTVTYGERGGGGPGSRAQTFQEAKRYFWVAVDAAGDGRFVTLPDSPHLTVVGGAAQRLVAVAPSTAAAGRPFRLLVRAEDAWGNPAHDYHGTLAVSAKDVQIPNANGSAAPFGEPTPNDSTLSDASPGNTTPSDPTPSDPTPSFPRKREPIPATHYVTFHPNDHGVRVIDNCTASRPGTHRICVEDAQNGLSAHSNPILCTEQRPAHNLYWADPHGGQVALAAKIPDFFRYARDVAALDFVGYQRNDHMISAADWRAQQEAEAAFTEPGRFVPLPGFEWSPETARGGHHNVYFRRHKQPLRRNSHAQVADKSDAATDLPHVRDLYAAYRHSDALITPHVGGAHADLRYHEPTLEPAIEITSTHGSFEWFLEEALERRYTVGFLGGSDSHTGRPGTDTPGYQPRRYAQAGLTGIYAADLTLDAFFEALQARRCYATTGARIVVQVDADGRPMGAAFPAAAPPTISVSITGTAPLESVELFRGLERIYAHPLDIAPDPRRVRILWQGASRTSSYSGVVWEGSAAISNGTVLGADTLRFDSPRSHLLDVTEHGLKWHSVTCGYRSGVVLTLADCEEAALDLAVATSLISRPRFGAYGAAGPQILAHSPADSLACSVALADLAAGPQEYVLGPLDRKVTVSLAPRAHGPETAAFTFTDPAPQPGVNPYWVRVVQTDMEMAWSSPVFVDIAGQ